MWILDWLPFWVFHLAVLLGIAGVIASLVFKFIPFISQYTLPIQVVSILVLVFGVYMEGGISSQEKWEAKVAAVKLEITQKAVVSAEISTKVLTKYITRVEIVKQKGDDIVKEVPIYITKVDDSKCVIPNGFVLLHNSASQNEVPDSTRGFDAGASEIKLSGVATTVIENYTTYYTVSEQLKSLQEWVRLQQKLYNE